MVPASHVWACMFGQFPGAKPRGQTQRHLADNRVYGPQSPSCSTHMVQDSRGPNWLETIDCSSTYLAGPAEPVQHNSETDELHHIPKTTLSRIECRALQGLGKKGVCPHCARNFVGVQGNT